MSKLAEFRQLEKHLAEQLQALEALKGDAGLQKEIDFEKKLRDLLAKYGYSLKDVINLLDPHAGRRAPVGEIARHIPCLRHMAKSRNAAALSKGLDTVPFCSSTR